MNNVEKYIISKDDFGRFFNNKGIIKRQDYIDYLRQKSCQTGCQIKIKKDTD